MESTGVCVTCVKAVHTHTHRPFWSTRVRKTNKHAEFNATREKSVGDTHTHNFRVVFSQGS